MADIEPEIQRAIELSEEGDVDTAMRMLTNILSNAPQNTQAHFERGMLHLSNNDLDGAIGDFQACLAVDSDYPGARHWLGRSYVLAGDNGRAAKEYEAGLRTDISRRNPDISPQQWADCSYAYENAGDEYNARRILSEYFGKYARRANVHKDLETAPMRQYANLLLELHEIPEAMRYASLAYKSRCRKPMDVFVYAKVAESSGDLALARRLCAEATELNDQMPGLQELHDRLNK